MSIFTVILRKLAGFFKIFLFIFKKIFSICRGRSRDRVGELPLYHKTNEASQSYNANASSFNNSEVAAAGSWNSWDDRSFGIESKIEEYRTKRLVSNSDHETKEEEEQDYFQEMQPKIKAPSKVELLNAFKQSNNVAASQKNLFEFKEDFVDIRNTGNTLGDLELDDYSSTPNDAAWDVDVDLETVDHALREASKRERDQIRSKRQQEHEKRRVQQKQKSHNSTSISIS